MTGQPGGQSTDQPINTTEWHTLEIWLDGELLERTRLSSIERSDLGPLDELIVEIGPVALSDYLEDWAIDSGLDGEPLDARVLHGWPLPVSQRPIMTHQLDAAEDELEDEDELGTEDEVAAANGGDLDLSAADVDQVTPGAAGAPGAPGAAGAAGAVLAGEASTLAATCSYLQQLAAHVREDIDPQLELAEAVLRQRELDSQTLTDLGRVRELLGVVGTALTSLSVAVVNRHGHIADAINASPADPADTGWYRHPAGRSGPC